MFLFCINALWHTPPREWFRQQWWLLGMAWIGLYALSYFWSSDIPYWTERVQVKFPFILFPLAFCFLRPLNNRQLQILSFGLMALAAGGCLYTLSFFFADPEKSISGYFYSQVLPTPAYKDHIRFSIFIAWIVIWCCFTFRKMDSPRQKAITAAAVIFFVLFLHLLAVRSGLLVLYTFISLYIIYLFRRGKARTASLILLSGIVSVSVAYTYIPSFRSKIQYAVYSLNEYEQGNHSADFSDIGRLISYDLAFRIIKEHPVLGVGAGDIREEMKRKYELYSPDTRPEQRIVPHNQLMEVTLAGGLVTLGVFLGWLFYPLRRLKKNRASFYVLATWLALFVAMMVEAMLEVQFGVFVYLFAMLWMQKATQSAADATPAAAAL
ncbi:MAG: O-antigen ligase family protein [Chitinophagaceae bacterium]|nr:O-antigen ligase family protein [Chitinophagaceae bacterium]